ncbi:MAG TPA: hypothetical protein VGO25_00185 [Rhodanobacteraceae bacterium]|nr:hypothetical protein [Rhodanobacteraceae bacterium]
MRACLLLVVLAILPCGSAFCADPSMWFPELTRLDLKDEGIRVWYPKANATPVTTRPAYLKDYDDAGVYGAQPLLLDLGHGLPTLALACDSGPSNDPSCRLLSKFDDPASAIFESAGNDFVFLTTAEIYVFGGTDYTYDHRRLFRFDGKHFAEIAQPFRYVGIEGKTKASLALTSMRSADAPREAAKKVLATLPPDTTITILLNAASGDNEYGQNPDYLVRTREGLIGWAHIPTRPDGTTIVEGLRYAGD